jgi:hypothetical protein
MLRFTVAPTYIVIPTEADAPLGAAAKWRDRVPRTVRLRLEAIAVEFLG